MRLILTLFVLLCASLATAQPRADADAAIVADFMKRVTAYVALHDRLDATLQEVPKEASAEQTFEHQRALARLIQRARARAESGDVITKEARALMRRRLASVFSGASGRELKTAVLEDYTGKLRIQINGDYPENVPLSTMPTQVLEVLPRLPDKVEYRFVGDRLVMLDSHARLVVDFVEHVF